MADEQQTERPSTPDEIRESVRTMCKALTVRNRGVTPEWCKLVENLCDDHETLTRAAQQKDGNKETGCLCPDCVSERMAIRAQAFGVLTVMVFDEGQDTLVCFQHNPDHIERIIDRTRVAVAAALDAASETARAATQQETRH